MKTILASVILTLAAVGPAAADETFVLIDETRKTTHGPFAYREGESIQVGESRLTLRKVEQKEAASVRVAKATIIPVLSFRAAALEDVVAFLRESTIEITGESKSLNILLKTKPSVATVTLSLRNVSVYDTLRYVAELLDLQLRWDENAVVISDGPTKPSTVTSTRGTPAANAPGAPGVRSGHG